VSAPIPKACTCGRPISERAWREGVYAHQVVPPGGPGEPAYLLELSNPCPCRSTLGREVHAPFDIREAA
jgi:hypothetical protein